MRNELINFRKSKNLTVNEIADKIGVSSSFYEKIEYGDRNPSYNFILMFKSAFPEGETDKIFFNQ
ncbi:MAG: helix-turn-helix transcriptional regulator [Gudongella sp.]|nr:helix-turn-helix transcriptional regulator [Gudongella sp.]